MLQPTFAQRLLQVYQQLKMLIWPFIGLVTIVLMLRSIYSREEVYFYVNRLHTSWGDWLFPRITELGSTGACVVFTALLFYFNKRQGIVLAAAYLFNSMVNFALKFMVAFPRPSRFFAERLHDIYFVPGVEVLDNFRSFPSGHSVCAFTAATVFSYYVKNKYWSWLFLLLAAMVAYSRMYMSQHFLEDVTAGATEAILLTMLWITLIKDKTPAD
ncbi:phosphatase PAP2 family protein [Chitinophaga oryzae]|uniref:Phosphatase PAP2 family protein n=1 Tax=Chitinophaga oryzae TaxID=2725414 RepID=A0AAE6ZGJ8_9BACT|nr:phosphatase PAP2 family protein [Chitinophaga oryzae]QJB31419.1 phosphatase PAP2 family protein [Chitinophaga oryzae]QJB37903.1 phosphatase PAP2 family protein [Chitinophaga oryzae]